MHLTNWLSARPDSRRSPWLRIVALGVVLAAASWLSASPARRAGAACSLDGSRGRSVAIPQLDAAASSAAKPAAGAPPARPAATSLFADRKRLATVTVAQDGERVYGVRAHQHGVVVDPRGRLWVLASRAPAAAPTEARLELHLSENRGRSFRPVATWPTHRVTSGGALASGDGVLHIVWSRTGDHAGDAAYRAFDTTTLAWRGDIVELARAVSRDGGFRGENVAALPGGGVAAVVSSSRGAPPPWPRRWSTALRLRAPGAGTFGELRPVNVAGAGVAPDVQLFGSVLHSSYRSEGRIGHGIYARRFDLDRGVFLDERGVPIATVGPRVLRGRSGLVLHRGREEQTGNVSAIAIDSDGGRYVAFYAGGSSSGRGSVQVSYGGRAIEPTAELVARDPPIRGGNRNDQHVSIANGPGNQVVVLYSRRADRHRILWERVYDEGRPVGPARAVAMGAVDQAFEWVSGVRRGSATSSVRAVVSGASQRAPGGEVALYGDVWPMRRAQ